MSSGQEFKLHHDAGIMREMDDSQVADRASTTFQGAPTPFSSPQNLTEELPSVSSKLPMSALSSMQRSPPKSSADTAKNDNLTLSSSINNSSPQILASKVVRKSSRLSCKQCHLKRQHFNVDIQYPRRLVSFFVYLNSLPQQQGATEFPFLEGSVSIQPCEGSAVLFPNVKENGYPEIHTVHRALPVTGTFQKLGLNIWLTDTQLPIMQKKLRSGKCQKNVVSGPRTTTIAHYPKRKLSKNSNSKQAKRTTRYNEYDAPSSPPPPT